MNNELVAKVFKNEYDFLALFTKKEVTEDYMRFYDDQLQDMYDHNFIELYNDLTPETYSHIKEIKEQRGAKHVKIVAYKKEKVLSILGYEHSIILTMAADTIHPNPLKINNVKYKNLKDSPELINDFLNLELKYYGDAYGHSFVARRMYRYFHTILESNNFNYFGCYINNKLVGYCYAFLSEGVIALDGLLVDEQYRHMNIASNLVKHIQSYYKNCPIYLHAEEDDYPQHIYEQLGFKTLYKKHEYLKLDEQDE